MSRSDEDLGRRRGDLDRLRAYVDSLRVGEQVPIEAWYQKMAELGLGRSDRQRLSDLRAEGYDVRFDRKLKAQVFHGIIVDGQVALPFIGETSEYGKAKIELLQKFYLPDVTL